ncbi:MAG: hypothetical protein LBN36_04320 [Clostridiales Family XIII bacterium]|jgi:hypothetical protein|nr:hypothetical protein [Clostridiales Family XIII bacterium]
MEESKKSKLKIILTITGACTILAGLAAGGFIVYNKLKQSGLISRDED